MSGRWIDVAGSDAVSETTPLGVEFDGQVVVVVRCGATLYAVEDRQLICPRHGARFCLRTGEALTPPAYEPVRTYAVREENGRVLLEQPP